MREHIIIRKEEFVTGSISKSVPTVFTQTHKTHPPLPYNRISIGETVWMKWSDGPIVAKAKVEGFRLLENCTVEEFRETVRGTNLYNHNEYWEIKSKKFNGMTIYIAGGEWLDDPIFSQSRSYSNSWIILDDEKKRKEWLG